MGYIKVDTIVRDVASDLGDSLHLYPRLLKYALRCVKIISYDTITTLLTKKLPVNINGTVDFPPDYVSYSKIGVLAPNGYVRVLGTNENMSLLQKTDACGDLERPFLAGDPRTFPEIFNSMDKNNFQDNGLTYFLNYFNGSTIGALFGYGGGHNRFGHYRINDETRQIQLASDVTDNYIILEYTGNGVKSGGETLVDERAYETIVAFIHWKFNFPKRNVGAGEKRDLERLFDKEHGKLRERVFAFTLEELKEALRYNYGPAVSN